jgi:hypothetical protein
MRNLSFMLYWFNFCDPDSPVYSPDIPDRGSGVSGRMAGVFEMRGGGGCR